MPAGCVGPVYSLVVDGGKCAMNKEGGVECTPPSIQFVATPLTCNLEYKSACSVEVRLRGRVPLQTGFSVVLFVEMCVFPTALPVVVYMAIGASRTVAQCA